jgi:hypothetical protein
VPSNVTKTSLVESTRRGPTLLANRGASHAEEAKAVTAPAPSLAPRALHSDRQWPCLRRAPPGPTTSSAAAPGSTTYPSHPGRPLGRPSRPSTRTSCSTGPIAWPPRVARSSPGASVTPISTRGRRPST